MQIKYILLPFILLFFAGCSAGKDSGALTSINIIDHNGFAETISQKERIQQYAKVDFENPMPYQKVTRTYKRDNDGNILSVLTTYYPNGQIESLVELINGRVKGRYKEWYSNGQKKLESHVLGGNPDIDSGAEKGWLFDQTCLAWDDNGNLEAEIPYSKGELQGEARYYHTNGRLWKTVPYEKNLIQGTAAVYLENGMLLQSTRYDKGYRHGETIRYWPSGRLAARENYITGKLWEAEYFTVSGEPHSQIKNGEGVQVIFGKEYIAELHTYKGGYRDGLVKILNKQGSTLRSYHVKEDVKHGEEVIYHKPNVPKLSIEWNRNKIHGLVKTWYPNGIQESQKEVCNNKKSGISMAWYQDGNLMLLEEFQDEKLVKGEYYRKGEKAPISRVINGKGVATLFDSTGAFLNELHYAQGKPLVDETPNP